MTRATIALILALFVAVLGWQYHQKIDRQCIRTTGMTCGEAAR